MNAYPAAIRQPTTQMAAANSLPHKQSAARVPWATMAGRIRAIISVGDDNIGTVISPRVEPSHHHVHHEQLSLVVQCANSIIMTAAYWSQPAAVTCSMSPTHAVTSRKARPCTCSRTTCTACLTWFAHDAIWCDIRNIGCKAHAAPLQCARCKLAMLQQGHGHARHLLNSAGTCGSQQTAAACTTAADQQSTR